MSERTNQLVSQLEHAIGNDSLFDVSNEIVEELINGDDGRDATPEILRIIESNEGIDFGMPGPLVHFLERFYHSGYEEQLLESVVRRATPHTLWMLNRIINGATGEFKSKCLEVMRLAMVRKDLSDAARMAASQFVTYQTNS